MTLKITEPYKLLTSPLRSLGPLLLLVLVETWFGMNAGYIAAIAASVILLYVNKFSRSGSQYLFSLVYIALLSVSYIVLRFFFNDVFYDDNEIRTVYSDVIVSVLLILSLFFVKPIRKFLSRRNKENVPFIENNIKEHLFVVNIVLFIFVGRIALYLLFYYKIMPSSSMQYAYNLQIVTVVVLMSLVIFEEFRVWIYRFYLSKEEFWPIVNRYGMVIGRESKRLALDKRSKKIHPVIRVYFVHKDKLYLKNKMFLLKRYDEETLLYWDVAVNKHLQYGETVDNAVLSMIEEDFHFEEEIKPIYIKKYLYKENDVSQLVFLFYVEVPEELVIINEDVLSGKFWDVEKIKNELIGTNAVSKKLEREFPFIKKMISRSTPIRLADSEASDIRPAAGGNF